MHLEGIKVIDEDRQGEAVMAEVPVIPNGKKMYLESYDRWCAWLHGGTIERSAS